MNPRWTLSGKKALITGGTRGIGKAVVEEYCSLGDEVTVKVMEIDKETGKISLSRKALMEGFDEARDTEERAKRSSSGGEHRERRDNRGGERRDRR